jgi:hypothetical protein
MQFATTINTVHTTPGRLYVGTDAGIYAVSNIDGNEQEGSPVSTLIHKAITLPGSEAYDTAGTDCYANSDRGLLMITSEGIRELTFNDISMPRYGSGTITVTEQGGLRYLVSVNTGEKIQ